MRKIFCYLYCLFFTFSCGSLTTVPASTYSGENIHIGDSKNIIINQFGNPYSSNLYRRGDDIVEELKYKENIYNGYLVTVFRFVNGHLEEKFQEEKYPPIYRTYPSTSTIGSTNNLSDEIIDLGQGYTKDKSNVYYRNKRIFGVLDSDSFSVIGDGYAMDRMNVYYKGESIVGATTIGFKVLGAGYAASTFSVYFLGKQVEDASAMFFEILEDGYAKDSSNVYYLGKKVPKVRPGSFRYLGAGIWGDDTGVKVKDGEVLSD